MLSCLILTLLFCIAEFPTNRTELHAVFDIFDRDGSGELDYKEFVDALRPERQVSEVHTSRNKITPVLNICIWSVTNF